MFFLFTRKTLLFCIEREDFTIDTHTFVVCEVVSKIWSLKNMNIFHKNLTNLNEF